MESMTIRSFPEPNSSPEEFIVDIEYVAQRMNTNIARVASLAGNREAHMVDYIIAAARRDDTNTRREDANTHLIHAKAHWDKTMTGYNDGQIRRKQARDSLDKAIGEAAKYATNPYDTAIKVVGHAKTATNRAIEAANLAAEGADEIVKVTKAVPIEALKDTKEAKAFEGSPETAASTAKTASSLVEKASKLQLSATAVENTANASRNKPYTATATTHAAKISEEAKTIAADAYQIASDAHEAVKKIGDTAPKAVAASTQAISTTKDIANDQARYARGFAETVKKWAAGAENETRKARDTAKQESTQAKTKYEKAVKDEIEDKRARAEVAQASTSLNEANTAIELFEKANSDVKAAASALDEITLNATQASIDVGKAAKTFTAIATPAVDEAKTEMDQAHLFLFRNQLTTSAVIWYGSLSENVKRDWGTLKIEFLRHFEK